MAKFELDPGVQGTMAFKALKTGSWLAAAGFEAPRQITELTERYYKAFPGAQRRRVQNHTTREVFNVFFDQLWCNTKGEGAIRQDGLRAYEDGSSLETWFEKRAKLVVLEEREWDYDYRATHLFLRADGAKPVDDLMITTCNDDGWVGRYLQENAFLLGEEAFDAYVEKHDEPTFPASAFESSPDGFRRYMCAVGRGRYAQREACFP